jgi:rubrerythrin
MPGKKPHWTLDDIPWARFDSTKVDPEIVSIVKAASMVEYNGDDYGAYLNRVFHDDREFCAAADQWALEEIQHGEALARWARLADPEFDFAAASERFSAGFRVDVNAERSIRGSRCGELIARCMVETGTSTYYTALHEAVEEPVLKEICRNIAADELRHYKLFYAHMKRYAERERIGYVRRLCVALARVKEAEGDELAYAYFAANQPQARYDRRACIRAYSRRAFRHYHPWVVERMIAMIFKAVGLRPHGRLSRVLAKVISRWLRFTVTRKDPMPIDAAAGA